MASIASRRLSKELQEINTEGCPVGTSRTRVSPPSDWVFDAGIKLLSADDFETWLFSIEVMGESQYQVLSSKDLLNDDLIYILDGIRERLSRSSSDLALNTQSTHRLSSF